MADMVINMCINSYGILCRLYYLVELIMTSHLEECLISRIKLQKKTMEQLNEQLKERSINLSKLEMDLKSLQALNHKHEETKNGTV